MSEISGARIALLDLTHHLRAGRLGYTMPQYHTLSRAASSGCSTSQCIMWLHSLQPDEGLMLCAVHDRGDLELADDEVHLHRAPRV